MNAIRSLGLSIPGDISIAGYDGIRLTRHLEPKLTTIRQDTAAIGAQAAEKLIALIERPKSTLVDRVMIEGSLYKGETVGKI